MTLGVKLVKLNLLWVELRPKSDLSGSNATGLVWVTLYGMCVQACTTQDDWHNPTPVQMSLTVSEVRQILCSRRIKPGDLTSLLDLLDGSLSRPDLHVQTDL